jgi:phage shock protein C
MINPEAPVDDRPRPVQDIRRLTRSRRDRVLGGVCGGLGRYLGIDPVVLRVVLVALVLSAGVGILAYLLAWLLIPEATGDEPALPPRSSNGHGAAIVVGVALVAAGALLLLRAIIPWFDSGLFWPLVVVAAGILIVVSARRG